MHSRPLREQSLSSNQQIDATNAEQTASVGMPPTATPPATESRDIGRNDFPVESLHLMNEKKP